ncbi:MAG: hypothetical protein LBK68_01280 [Candidatus Margulisbacteria bacterium]|jgi:hypothetical protein|nr:hypothetical protein [Candidatus Margulisiibacteriota bacterium]
MEDRYIEATVGGGLSSNIDQLAAFVFLAEVHPEWLNPNIKATTVFDSFPQLPWNGGRCIENKSIPFSEMQKRVNFFNERGIGVNFTFTNSLLKEAHLEDKPGNQILRAFENRLNGVVIYSPLLAHYVRKTNPLYKIILSQSKLLWDKTQLLATFGDYDLVVVSPEFNRDIAFLKQLPAEKTSLIANNSCAPFCPLSRQHFDAISMLNFGEQVNNPASALCQSLKQKGTLRLRPSEVFNIFSQTGIKNFKFATRNYDPQSTINTLGEYFVLSAHKDDFLQFMAACC